MGRRSEALCTFILCIASAGGKKRKYKFNRRMTGPHSSSVGGEKETKVLSLSGSEWGSILLDLKQNLFFFDRGDNYSSQCNFDRWKEMLRPPTLRPLMLVVPYFLIQQFAGMASIRPYMVHVFRQLGLDDAAGWTTVITHFSHTRKMIIKPANMGFIGLAQERAQREVGLLWLQ
jgi:hypothetical protein